MSLAEKTFRIPLSLAVALNATTPDPGGASAIGVIIWSTTTASLLRWSGTAWVEVAPVMYLPNITTLVSTQASSVTAMANITALTAALVANATYEVHAFVTFKSAAITTGINLGYVVTGSTYVGLNITVPVASTGVGNVNKIFPNAAESTTGAVTGSGVTATASNHTCCIEGVIKTNAAGNLNLQFASEVGASAITLQIGSTLIVTRIA